MTRIARFKQEMPKLQLSIERSTGEVPNDGRYHVVVAGEVVFSAASQQTALAFYRKERDRLFQVHGRPEPPRIEPEERQRWIQQQRVEIDLRAMSKELVRTVVANARRKGGKGR